MRAPTELRQPTPDQMLQMLQATWAGMDRGLHGWDEIEDYCKTMGMQNRWGRPPTRQMLIRYDLPRTYQGPHGQAYTTTFAIIAWWFWLSAQGQGPRRVQNRGRPKETNTRSEAGSIGSPN